MKKIRLYTMVWGEKYTDWFLKYSLPSNFSKNNFPSIVDKAEIDYTIYTTEADRIISSDIMKYVTSLIPVNYIDASGTNGISDGLRYGEYYKGTLKPEQAYHKIICPDGVVSDGSIAFAWDKILKGYEVVGIPTCGLRVDPQRFIPLYNGVNSSTNLVRLFLSTMHSDNQDYFIDSKTFNRFSQSVYFRDGDKFRCHSNSVQAYFLNLEHATRKFCSFETDQLSTFNIPKEKIFLVSSPEEMFEVNLTEDTDERPEFTFNWEEVAQYIRGNRDRLDHLFFKHGYGNIDSTPKIKAVVDKIVQRMDDIDNRHGIQRPHETL